MRGLDDTDREILTLLLEDSRRPYSEIADRVDLSPPAVSDRIDRLDELGLIRGFTIDIDRSMLQEGVPVLVDLQIVPGHTTEVQSALAAADAFEHMFVTADERLVCTGTVPATDVSALLSETVDMALIDAYEVDLLVDSAFDPGVVEWELAPDCAECGNTVTSEGETTRLDGELYQFCCSSCEAQFVEQYEQLREDADL